MNLRPDISTKLIHFTKGEHDKSQEAAFIRFQKILNDGFLRGGTSYISGSYHVVCFTEAPLEALTGGFKGPYGSSDYSSFGFIFDKNWVFGHGGRPVIYQPDSDYVLLPEELKWRHMRFEPTAKKRIDYSWEREWRIKADKLVFGHHEAALEPPSCKGFSLVQNLRKVNLGYLADGDALTTWIDTII